MSAPTSLSTFVRDRYYKLHEREPTSRQLAHAAGMAFSHTTAAKILNGTHGTIDEPTAQGLASALRVDIATIRELSGVASHSLGPFQLPERAARLTQRERDTVLRVVDTILRARRREP